MLRFALIRDRGGVIILFRDGIRSRTDRTLRKLVARRGCAIHSNAGKPSRDAVFGAHFNLVHVAIPPYLATHSPTRELEKDCMKKAVFAGAFALAMMGPLFVSEHGFGPSTASAQNVVVTEGKIARLRAAVRLTGEQLHHWRPVEAALRAAIREQREAQGLVQKVRDH